MILGDPYKFAIIYKKIDAWNIDNAFCNGILLFCIDGYLYPNKICTVTLKSEIVPLRKKLENIPIDSRLFSMKKELAFSQIYKKVFPEDYTLPNNYEFDITPLAFADENCFVFAVSNGVNVRILAAVLQYVKEKSQYDLENIEVKETFVAGQELETIARTLRID